MKIPQHIAIIMDGNGRWAKKQNRPRSFGHYQGTENVRNIAIKANELGVKVLTLYAFSTENWKRPAEEIDFLMSIPAIFIERFLAELMEKGIRIKTIGDLEPIPEKTKKVLLRAIETTKDNSNMTLVFALNYGSRKEIVNGINKYVEDVNNNCAPYPLTEELFEKYLETSEFPEIDLLIRTSLDYRLSNFLLWQLSYSELYFTDIYWPQFTGDELVKAIEEFSNRQRRFGGLNE